jgi:hypothetical protein
MRQYDFRRIRSEENVVDSGATMIRIDLDQFFARIAYSLLGAASFQAVIELACFYAGIRGI